MRSQDEPKRSRRAPRVLFNLVLCLVLFPSALALREPAFAQVPQLIRYQGTLTDSLGKPLEGSFNLTFRFYDAATGGTKMWEETQTGVSVTKGAFSVLLGSVTPLDLAFDIDCWLGVSVNGGAELSPRTRVASVPNTYLAARSERLDRSERIHPNNLVKNGSLESWSKGDSSAPDGWSLGPGSGIAKETTQVKIGSAAASLTRSGVDAKLSQEVTAQAGGSSYIRGRTYTFCAWARSSVASRARIFIQDGVGTSVSGYHTGAGSFELLIVTRKLEALASKLEVGLEVTGGDTTAQFDGAMLVEGPMPFAFHPGVADGKAPIGARICHSAHQSIALASLTPLAFDTKRYDSDGCYDPTQNFRLFCRTAGRYLIIGHVRWDNRSVGTRMIWIRLNGTLIASQTLDASSGGADQGLTVATVYPLQVGDFVELIVYHWGTGGALSVLAWPEHSPELLMEKIS